MELVGSKKKGKLICVCDVAGEDACAACPKYRAVKPDVIFQFPSWKQDVDSYDKELSKIMLN